MLTERRKQIFSLTLPILGGMLSQNILNLVDAAMVGSLGNAALGGVGIAGFVNFLCASFFIGLATGVQSLVARNMGSGHEEKAAVPLNGGLVINIILAIPLSIILVFLSDKIMAALVSDPAVVEQSSPYLAARVAGMVALGCNFAFRGFWTSIGTTGIYMRTLLMMHALNIFLNYTLIFGNFGFPKLGTFGAGLGTTISLFCGTLFYIYYAFKNTRHLGFAHRLPSTEAYKSIFKISLPSALQQLFFAGGFTTLFWIIAKVGTAALAGANAVINLTLVAILPCIAFGITANSLVSNALGKENPEDAYQWGWDVSKVAFIFVLIIGLPLLFFPTFFLSAFLHDKAALMAAKIPLQLVGIGIAFDAIALVLMSALQGAGASKQTMIVGIVMQWGIFLPIAYILGPVLGMSLTAIWIAQMLYRTIQMFLFIMLWKQRKWQSLKFQAH